MDGNVNNIVLSKLIEIKSNYKYLIVYLDKVIRPLPKMSGYVKNFKVKSRNKDNSSKMTSIHLDDDKLLVKYKTIWINSGELKNI